MSLRSVKHRTTQSLSRRRLLQAAAGLPVLALSRPSPLFGAPKPMAVAAVLELGASAAIQHIRDGNITAEFYAGELLKWFNAHRDLNTVITIHEAEVLAAARAADQARTRGEKQGALAGLPFIVKDEIDVAGYPTTEGTAALRNYFPKKSATVVEIMLREGGIVFAKANLHENASGLTSSNRFYGFVHNPYDLTRIPGGSSGGTAAAVAARIVPAGLGEDSLSSVRLPASLCGVASLRPSTGGSRKRYSDAGLTLPASPHDTQTIGPMARTVADVAFLDSVITGQTSPPLANLRDVRIGIPQASFWEYPYIDPGVAKVTHGIFDRLREAGATLVEFDLNALIDLGSQLGPAIAGDNNEDIQAWLAQNVPGVTLKDLGRGQGPALTTESPLTRLSDTQKADLRARAARQYANVLQSSGLVALAFPCVPIPAPLIQAAGDRPGQKIDVNGQAVDERDVLIHEEWWGARLGAPAVIVPGGLAAGLPVGLELEGLVDDDRRLLALGMAIEKIIGPLPPPALMQSAG